MNISALNSVSQFSITRTGLAGIQSGLSQAANSAIRVSKAFTPDSDDDAVIPIIDMKRAEQQVKASSKVVKIGDEMLGTILDIFA